MPMTGYDQSGEGGSEDQSNGWQSVGERPCPREGVREMDGLTD